MVTACGCHQSTCRLNVTAANLAPSFPPGAAPTSTPVTGRTRRHTVNPWPAAGAGRGAAGGAAAPRGPTGRLPPPPETSSQSWDRPPRAVGQAGTAPHPAGSTMTALRYDGSTTKTNPRRVGITRAMALRLVEITEILHPLAAIIKIHLPPDETTTTMTFPRLAEVTRTTVLHRVQDSRANRLRRVANRRPFPPKPGTCADRVRQLTTPAGGTECIAAGPEAEPGRFRRGREPGEAAPGPGSTRRPG